MENKTIIFGAPGKDSLTAKIVANLRFHGFKVIDISFDQTYRYRKLSDKVYNFLRKTFLNDTSHKKKLRFQHEKPLVLEKLSQIEKADYALIIRPDAYPKEFISQLKDKTKQLIGYQWDGISRFPEIEKYTELFDRFFVFDEADVKPGFLPLTNFYFDDDLNEGYKKSLPSVKKVFFIGTFMKSRVKPFSKISAKIKETDFENDMYLYSNKKKVSRKYGDKINIVTKFLSYEEVEKLSKEAMVLADITSEAHNGLSFRTFEAIKLKKKLITNNPSVKKYDFYHENRFLVLENDDDYAKIPAFLEVDYQELPIDIYEKYSFANWIKYVLDIEPHQKIELPIE